MVAESDPRAVCHRGVVCDVSQRSSIAAAKQETIGSFGRVHILCNNAGIASGGLIEDISDWQWVIGVNFLGIVHGVSEFVPHFKSQRADPNNPQFVLAT